MSSSTIVSLTEEDFEERLSSRRSAMVAFITPWCAACRMLMAELERAKLLLAKQASGLLVAQCDVSRETRLAKVYQAWRTPLVLLFPDTRVLAPGLQVTFTGQLQQANLLAFATGGHGPSPRHVHSMQQLWEATAGTETQGTFVGFFKSPTASGLLQELWPLDCLRRHQRAVAFARWDHDRNLNSSNPEDGPEQLWHWAGLSFKEKTGSGTLEGLSLKHLSHRSDVSEQPMEEAIVYVRRDGSECQFAPAGGFSIYQDGGSSSSTSWPSASSAKSKASWRDQVDAFCAWCERQVLAPVTVFNAPRAAALDGTFDWLLLLFASQATTEDQEVGEEVSNGFPWERKRLERFTRAACAQDKRYQEVLPVIVPWGSEDISAFRASFGLQTSEPVFPLPQDSGEPCKWLQGDAIEDDEYLDEQSRKAASARRRRHSFFATVLFNTRTRRKYLAPAGSGWCPGDELALCHFTDAVLDGRVSPVIRSTSRRPDNSAAPDNVKDVIASSLSVEVLQPVAAGFAEVLLFLHAPFCGHSVSFFPLWRRLADAIAAATMPGDPAAGEKNASHKQGALMLAQMDGILNEHPHMPPVREFPTLILCLPDTTSSDNHEAESSKVRFVTYKDVATLPALLSWIANNSAFAPPLVGVEGLR